MSEQSLTSRRIVVGGGTGDVGIEIVRALLLAGAEVIVPARSPDKGAALRDNVGSLGRLAIVDGFPENDSDVERLGQQIGEVHGAIAALGSWRRAGALTALPLDEWHRAVDGNLTPHFMFAKMVLPRLTDDRQYVMVNGAGALSPVPHSAHISIMAAAQLMLGAALQAENAQTLFHTVMLKSIIATRAQSKPDPSWITSQDVGRFIVWLLGKQGRQTAGSTVTLSARHNLGRIE